MTNGNKMYRVELFGNVTIRQQATFPLVPVPGGETARDMGVPYSRLLVCMGVHAAVTGEWSIHRNELAKCAFQSWNGEDYSDVENSLTTAITRLRGFMKEAGRDAIHCKRGHFKYGLNKNLIAVDAVEFWELVGDAKTTDDIEEKIETLLKAVQISDKGIHTCEIRMDRFARECQKIEQRRCEARHLLALCYEMHHEPDQAIQYADAALAIDGTSKKALEILARLKRSNPVSAVSARLVDNSSPTVIPITGNHTPQTIIHAPPILPTLRGDWNKDVPIDARTLTPHIAPTYDEIVDFSLKFDSFIGRESERNRLISILEQHLGDLESRTGPRKRLITLWGASGSGKTRLAQEIAGHAYSMFRGNIHIVSLITTERPELILDRIADSLIPDRPAGQSVIEQLERAFSKSPYLLVLDNFEHLVDRGGNNLQRLVLECPLLICIVTSQVLLRVRAEEPFRVAPLPYPDEREVTRFEKLEANESFRLFVERAKASCQRSGFDFTPSDAWGIARVCRQLEGLPLAIELAAAYADTYSPKQIGQQIEMGGGKLKHRQSDAPSRHQSLETAFQWSCSLLKPEWQELLGHLSVFRGGADLEAVKALCPQTDLLDALVNLCDRSLVNREKDVTGFRYRMLEALRVMAMEGLNHDQLSTLSRRHAEYFLELAITAQPHLYAEAQAVWLERLDRERDNLTAALGWFVSQSQTEPDKLYRMTEALQPFWWIRGNLGEGLELSLATLSVGAEGSDALRARVMTGAGVLATWLGQNGQAEALLERSLSLHEKSGDRSGFGFCKHNMAELLIRQGDFDAAREALMVSLAISRETQNEAREANDLHELGEIAYLQRDLDTAQSFFEAGLAIRRRAKDSRGIAQSLQRIGDILSASLHFERAIECYRECLMLRVKLKDKYGCALSIEALAQLVMRDQQYQRATRLYAIAGAIRSSIGAIPSDALQTTIDQAMFLLTTKLTQAIFTAAWDDAGALHWHQGVIEALSSTLTSPRVSIDKQNLASTRKSEETASNSDTGSKPPNNLPADVTTIIERKAEQKAILDLIRRGRLVTLTGSGGSGKTTLALSVANELLSERDAPKDGIWLVELENLADPDTVAPQIAKEVGMDTRLQVTEENLLSHLRERELILVLDNCEHLSGVCGRIATLIIRRCHGIKILATSRRKLPSDSLLYEVGGMSVPPADVQLTVDRLGNYEAARLFCERISDTYSLGENDAYAVGAICRRLQGIPLAIKLAASKVRLMTPQGIEDSLSACFALLNMGSPDSADRQQTMRSTIKWSYGLLGAQTRLLFSRLSVLAGGWSHDAAEKICSGHDFSENEVLAHTEHLLNDSLIVSKPRDGRSRFHMLDTTREFAEEQLDQAERELLRTRHLNYFVEMASKARRSLWGPEQTKQLDALDAEYANILHALAWAFMQEGTTDQGMPLAGSIPLIMGIKLISALGLFFGVRENLSAVRALYEGVLTSGQPHALTNEWAALYHDAGGFARMMGDYDIARAHYMEGRRIWIELGDQKRVASSLYCVGLAYYEEGCDTEAKAYFKEALDINRSLGNERNTAICLFGLASIAWQHGEDSVAEPFFSESLEIMARLHDAMGIAAVHYHRANFDRERGRSERAFTGYLVALAIEWTLGDRPRIAEILEGLATLEMERSRLGPSAYLYGVAHALRDETGMPVPLRDRRQLEHRLAYVMSAAEVHELHRIYKRISESDGANSLLAECCQNLRSEAPDIWNAALESINVRDVSDLRYSSGKQLLISLGHFFRIRGHLKDNDKYYKYALGYPVGWSHRNYQFGFPTGNGSSPSTAAFRLSDAPINENGVPRDTLTLPSLVTHAESLTQHTSLVIEAGTNLLLQGDHDNGQQILEEACRLSRLAGDLPMTAKALHQLSNVLGEHSSYDTRREYCRESLAIWRSLKDPDGIASALRSLGYIELHMGNLEASRLAFEECLSLYQTLRNDELTALVFLDLGHIMRAKREYRAAIQRYSSALAKLTDQRNMHGIGHALHNLGYAYRETGEIRKSYDCYLRAINLFMQSGEQEGIGFCLMGLATLSGLQGNYDEAVRLASSAKAIYTNKGLNIPPDYLPEFEATLHRYRSEMSAREFDVAWAEGRHLNIKDWIGRNSEFLNSSDLGANEVAMTVESMRATSMEDMIRNSLDPTPSLSVVACNTQRSSEGVEEKSAANEKIARTPYEPTAFIGRDDEIEQILKLLAEARLVTLCGSGGIGKTRIAFRILSRLQHQFPDGVHLIELASETEPARFLQNVFNAVGVNFTDGCTSQAAIDFIGDKQVLMLLDNCEHMAGECADLAQDLLRHCGGLRILATSRDRLKIDEEQVFSVPPMSFPTANENISAPLLDGYEATKLFCARAKAADDKFLTTDSAANDIAAICERLDGLPLAIELAAAWISLGTHEIKQQLCASFEILNSGSRRKTERQRTIRATIDWSCKLLDPGDVQLFGWLSIFAGGWTLEAARSICSDALLSGTKMLKSHVRLMDLSLIFKPAGTAGSRFGMREMIREYSAGLLSEEDRLTLNGLHATYFTEFAARNSALLYGCDQASAMSRIGDDYYNILLALDRFASEGGDHRQGMALSASMARYWWLNGYLVEGRRYLEKFLDSPSNQSPSAERAMALNELGSLAFLQGDRATNAKAYTEALKIAEGIGHLSIMAVAHRGLGSLHMSNGELDKAGQHFEASENCSCTVNDELNYFLAIEKRGQLAIWTRDYESAKFHLKKCVINSRQNGNLQGLSSSLYHLSQVHFGAREYDDVERLCTEADEIDRELGFPGARAASMLGVTAMRRGNIDSARIILEETLERKRSTKKPDAILPALRNLARACIVKADYAAGKLLLLEALRLACDQKISRHIALTLQEMGCHAAAVGEMPRAAVLWGASEVVGMPPIPGPPNYDTEYRAEYEAKVRANLPPAELIMHTERGRSFTESAAILYALNGTL